MPHIYFTRKEIEELFWIVPQFKDTHEKHYIVAEKEVVESIIKKLTEVTYDGIRPTDESVGILPTIL